VKLRARVPRLSRERNRDIVDSPRLRFLTSRWLVFSEAPLVSATISLAGKIALVTGGGRGIGKAIARRLAEAGAGVVIASRKAENLQATAAELAHLPGKIIPITCHVGRLEQLENLIRETEARLGPVDVLVNNSATNLGQGPALAATDEMLDKMVEINVKSALRLVRLTVPRMIERGGGSIINIASIAGLQPQPGGLLYIASRRRA
jgi:dehydrogenase/reductase SDR family member 4